MKIRSLDLPFAITPSTPFMEMHLYEVASGNSSRIEFLAWYGADGYEKMIAKFESFVAGRMQTFWGDFGDLSIGEIVDSAWLDEYRKITSDNQSVSCQRVTVKHFFFVGHDVCVEILASGIAFEHA